MGPASVPMPVVMSVAQQASVALMLQSSGPSQASVAPWHCADGAMHVAPVAMLLAKLTQQSWPTVQVAEPQETPLGMRIAMSGPTVRSAGMLMSFVAVLLPHPTATRHMIATLRFRMARI